MKHYKVEISYDEPMVATAVFLGEDEDQVRENVSEFGKQRGMKETRILEITEISEDEANEIRRQYIPEPRPTLN